MTARLCFETARKSKKIRECQKLEDLIQKNLPKPSEEGHLTEIKKMACKNRDVGAETFTSCSEVSCDIYELKNVSK